MKITQGSSRIVFIFENYVLKIPSFKQYDHFLLGLLGNLRERKMSGRHPDLAKVCWCFPLGLCLCMERAYPIFVDDWGKFKDELEVRYQDDEMKDFMLQDTKPSNWGIIRARRVKIDYG